MFQVPSWKSGVGQGWAFGSAKTLRCPCRREKSTLKWIEERQTSYKVYSIEICTALRFFQVIWLYFAYDNSVCNTKNFEPGVHPAPKPSFSKSEGRQVLRKALLHIYCKDKQHSLGWSWKGPVAWDEEAVGGSRRSTSGHLEALQHDGPPNLLNDIRHRIQQHRMHVHVPPFYVGVCHAATDSQIVTKRAACTACT